MAAPPVHGPILVPMLFGGLVALALAAPDPLQAAVCTVPTTSHPTVGAALRDGACTTLQLAAGSYEENLVVTRALEVAGAGSGHSILAGALSISGATTEVTLSGLAIDGTAAGVAGCWPSVLFATGGARVAAGDDVVVTNSGIADGPCRLFADGFESGGVLTWSVRSLL